jgi:V8-like Glu-specific endopeptidase
MSARSRIATLAAIASLVVVTGLPTIAGAAPAGKAPSGGTPARPSASPSKAVPALERNSRLDLNHIMRSSRPVEVPNIPGRPEVVGPPAGTEVGRPDGPEIVVGGTLPAEGSASAESSTSTATLSSGPVATTSATQNGAWTGSLSTNPNRQIGKLYFDTQPGVGERWNHCTATVVTADNKSTLVTAGHCVYNPDPDKNGLVESNGYWFENFVFCPGYEYGCKLGQWRYRQVATTSRWFYGTSGRYDIRDDVAVVLLNRNTSSQLVQNVTGSQGIAFNRSTGLTRHSFGYPGADTRWPAYSYNGEDLIYARGVDTWDTAIPGTMWMNNTMTGGASGGPWLIDVGSAWLGVVNSVNSHKPYGGAWMSGAYFDKAEADLWTYWKTR